jgi:hypothetical protein
MKKDNVLNEIHESKSRHFASRISIFHISDNNNNTLKRFCT